MTSLAPRARLDALLTTLPRIPQLLTHLMLCTRCYTVFSNVQGPPKVPGKNKPKRKCIAAHMDMSQLPVVPYCALCPNSRLMLIDLVGVGVLLHSDLYTLCSECAVMFRSKGVQCNADMAPVCSACMC